MSEWKSIETAPKCKPVLVWDDYYLMRIGYYNVYDQWVTDSPCVEDEPIKLSPTHWQSLPKTPESFNDAD